LHNNNPIPHTKRPTQCALVLTRATRLSCMQLTEKGIHEVTSTQPLRALATAWTPGTCRPLTLSPRLSPVSPQVQARRFCLISAVSPLHDNRTRPSPFPLQHASYCMFVLALQDHPIVSAVCGISRPNQPSSAVQCRTCQADRLSLVARPQISENAVCF
jgi:hypothetical protein